MVVLRVDTTRKKGSRVHAIFALQYIEQEFVFSGGNSSIGKGVHRPRLRKGACFAEPDEGEPCPSGGNIRCIQLEQFHFESVLAAT